jgi:type IV secretory pathway TrbD component
VITNTLASFVVPGLGHILARKTATGALILLAFGAGLAVAILHLTQGLSPFESKLGGFLFPVLLRGLILLHVFAVFDAYVWGVDPKGDLSLPRRRQAVLLNLLVPGAGYLVARAWIRAATGLALLTLVLFFARSGSHPYLDLIFVGMQAIMTVAVYHQMGAAAQAELDKQSRPAPDLPKVPAAQVILLLAATLAVFGFGYVLQRALPGVTYVTQKDIQVRPGEGGIRFAVPKLGLSMTAAGTDWVANATPTSGLLFEAQHKRGASLMVGLQPIPNFVRKERYLGRVREWMESKSLAFKRSIDLRLGGRDAVQMRFVGPKQTDHWTVTVPAPEQKVAYLVMISCERSVCKSLLPELERTRDSFRLGDGPR